MERHERYYNWAGKTTEAWKGSDLVNMTGDYWSMACDFGDTIPLRN